MDYSHYPVLVIEAGSPDSPHFSRAVQRITDEIQKHSCSIISSFSYREGFSLFRSHYEVSCLLIDWDLRDPHASSNPGQDTSCTHLITQIRQINDKVPIFLLTEKHKVQDIKLVALRQVSGYVWKTEDTPHFVAGRIVHALKTYLNSIMPPFFSALINYNEDYRYSWHTPGHMGGTAFLKSRVGRIFYDFFGENVFRSDLSISVPELGSLLDHSGPLNEAEVQASKVFGSDRTFFVTNGTSSANKIVLHSCLTPGEVVLVDRNCHKSLIQVISMIGAVPIWLPPSRNPYGIIGGIGLDILQPEAIRERIRSHPLLSGRSEEDLKPRIAILTNSTYDGIIYNVAKIKKVLGQSVAALHFDEAWFPYAKFHEIYAHRFGMFEEPVDVDDDSLPSPTIYTTQSTHKLLAAFSQASMIHVKQGRRHVDWDVFNEAFMMHSSTSPQYSILASLDVATQMMDGRGGRNLVRESISEAMIFRRKLVQLAEEIAHEPEGTSTDPLWFFNVWQPAHGALMNAQDEAVSESLPQSLASSRSSIFANSRSDVFAYSRSDLNLPFAQVPQPELYSPIHWSLSPGESWHGFSHIQDEDYLMLDPIKVTLICPGLSDNGEMNDEGVPALLVTKYLQHQGIVAEKTGFYTLLVLFSIGVTRGKSSTLLAELLSFKSKYDANLPLEGVLPKLVARYPDRYKNLGLKDLGLAMHRHLKERNLSKLEEQMLAHLPDVALLPGETLQRLIHGKNEKVTLDKLENRIVAIMIVPYPPGIPVLMPGERVTSKTCEIVEYLKLLESYDNAFPGFETDTHGVSVVEEKGKKVYKITVVVE